jgi:plastocyanin domain-containing protein
MALLRGNIELKSLDWNNKAIQVVLSPALNKRINLNLPGPVEKVLVNGKAVRAASRKGNTLSLQLEKGKECRVEITKKKSAI